MKIECEQETFKWRDYKEDNKIKEMTISTQEFIRRFLLHILPPNFMKIRYYGLLGNRNNKKKILKCKIMAISTLRIVEENYYYVDKTNYIEKLEDLAEPNVMFLRPRKFGKTLFASVLEKLL